MRAGLQKSMVVFQPAPHVPTGQKVNVPELLAECLDAHADTLRLAQGLLDSPEWQAHSTYLKDLERVGRTALARL
jgi:hypothetical protein